MPQGTSCACNVARRRKRIASELNLIAMATLNFEIVSSGVPCRAAASLNFKTIRGERQARNLEMKFKRQNFENKADRF
nr:hypothetical protein [uncultured Campylobacter sp.]